MFFSKRNKAKISPPWHSSLSFVYGLTWDSWKNGGSKIPPKQVMIMVNANLLAEKLSWSLDMLLISINAPSYLFISVCIFNNMRSQCSWWGDKVLGGEGNNHDGKIKMGWMIISCLSSNTLCNRNRSCSSFFCLYWLIYTELLFA